MTNINRIITICYVSLQISIALVISVIGAVHVKRCMNKPVNTTKTRSAELTKDAKHNKDQATNIVVNEPKATQPKRNGFCKLWFKTIWKMRNVYGGLSVHSFDVLTDMLVIVQWLQFEDISGDNIDPQVMAYSAIAVLIASKVISSIAIYTKEGNFRRAIFQFCDLLIFEEIYESHKKFQSQFKDAQSIVDKNNTIESTLSFKYVRHFEAVFESIPQSVLQLVFIMRIPPTTDKYNPIFIISILQSIISMTNTILNNDYAEMQDDGYKKYKQRFPPTCAFFKHAIFRLSEVICRIGILSLCWTVCGGVAFGIVLGIEISHMSFRICHDAFLAKTLKINGDTLLVYANSLIIVPSQDMYSGTPNTVAEYLGSLMCQADGCVECLFVGCFTLIFLNCCFCGGLAAFLSSCIRSVIDQNCNVPVYDAPTMRIGASLMELIFIILYGIYGKNGENKNFLLSADHGLSTLIVTCICLGICSQYLLLFPSVSLPLDVPIRTKWGYAYSNELTELQKIKVKYTKKTCTGKAKPKKIRTVNKSNQSVIPYEIKTAADFWDEPFKYYFDDNDNYDIGNKRPITAAMFALAKQNDDIVQWLEQQGAAQHKDMDTKDAANLIGLAKTK